MINKFKLKDEEIITILLQSDFIERNGSYVRALPLGAEITFYPSNVVGKPYFIYDKKGIVEDDIKILTYKWLNKSLSDDYSVYDIVNEKEETIDKILGFKGE